MVIHAIGQHAGSPRTTSERNKSAFEWVKQRPLATIVMAGVLAAGSVLGTAAALDVDVIRVIQVAGNENQPSSACDQGALEQAATAGSDSQCDGVLDYSGTP